MIRGVLDEFKQRSVVRVAGIYAVAGWAVFQVVNTLFPALDLPRWTVSLSALLFLAGFPVAIGLAWFFEVTDEGVRLTPRDRRGFGGGRFGWIDWLVGAVVVLVFGFAVVQLVTVLRSDGEPGAPAAAPARSVAVLPFASFSEVRGDEYFADGLTEELINSSPNRPSSRWRGAPPPSTSRAATRICARSAGGLESLMSSRGACAAPAPGFESPPS